MREPAEKKEGIFWELLDKIAGEGRYGEECLIFNQEEQGFTQRILQDPYFHITALIDTFVGFLRETIKVIVRDYNKFDGDPDYNFNLLLLLRATTLRAQSIRKLLTSGYCSEAVGLTRTIWETFELFAALRLGIVTFEEFMGGKRTLKDLNETEPHIRRKNVRKERRKFEKKLNKIRDFGTSKWTETEKNYIDGWVDLMHGALHRNSLEFYSSRQDAQESKLTLSISFEKKGLTFLVIFLYFP